MRQRKTRANGPVRKRKKWPWLVTAGIFVALIGAMAVPGIRNGPIGQVVGRTIAPLQEAYAYVEGQVRDWFTIMDENNTLLRENQRMKAENDEIATCLLYTSSALLGGLSERGALDREPVFSLGRF